MPIGEFTKEELEKLPKELVLTVATKPDSQEICFVEDNDYGRFIGENTDYKIVPGTLWMHREKLGRHKGIIYYTIGQRKGLGIAFGKPMFVVDIDIEKNRVVLGDEKEVFSRKSDCRRFEFYFN